MISVSNICQMFLFPLFILFSSFDFIIFSRREKEEWAEQKHPRKNEKHIGLFDASLIVHFSVSNEREKKGKIYCYSIFRYALRFANTQFFTTYYDLQPSQWRWYFWIQIFSILNICDRIFINAHFKLKCYASRMNGINSLLVFCNFTKP